MNFRTPIPIPKSNRLIDYNSKIVSLGSCFAVNMAEKLDYFKFQNTCNPFGILFHPLAIEKFIDFAVSKKQFTENDIFFHNELWHCFDAHSDLSNPDREELLVSLNAVVQSAKIAIEQASHVIITYGTSWVYKNIESNEVVANCHKVPQKQFEKSILSIETIQKSIRNTIDLIQKVNSKCCVIFTVSPVRHIKDGFVENQWSKANLISSIHQVIQTEHLKLNTGYFPSYEIMIDELRDYRFYSEDMLHPNQVAIDYIWKRFKETTISDGVFTTMEEVENIQKSLMHRPFNPQSESHLKFVSKLNQKITKLETQNPFMKF
ncbi:GSCFA domain-containing protein [Flavobacterium sp. I-SCBP12n]|uniref:GSCFA domain-containing protein n=1 Tax=Flavobacterium pygoscelis TaxID=2893176 RepID=A0A9X1XRI9_9FLAO|nr:GSCFA domain-containing protein [Flavobacterium pygoscelis]MCK8141977.1 GSCFA domain-containing protein [Flavobacterium pygoscelis]